MWPVLGAERDSGARWEEAEEAALRVIDEVNEIFVEMKALLVFDQQMEVIRGEMLLLQKLNYERTGTRFTPSHV